MPDISMCFGGMCPRKLDCYRHTAKPGVLQIYFHEPPYEFDGAQECDAFIDNRNREVRVTEIGTYEVTPSTST
jgi:hypothetical protein